MPKPTALLARVGRHRSLLLGALLSIALGVTGVVTYQAHVASREHRAIVERVLHDYVAVATYQIGQSTKMALHSCMSAWLQSATSRLEYVPIEKLPLTDCGNSGKTRFDFDFNTGIARTWGQVAPKQLAWLRDTIPQHPVLTARNGWSYGVLSLSTGEGPELAVFAVKTVDGAATRAVGFLADSVLEFVAKGIVALSPLLPPDLRRGADDSVFFAVRIGNYQPTNAEYSQRATLDPAFGSLAYAVELKHGSLDRIIPGGLPKDRGPELLMLLTLAMGLVLSSLWLLQREAQLARARAGFVSSVSHELRTPLAQIRMFAEMLLLGRVRNEVDRRRSLEIIDKEARRLTQLVENVLQVARSEYGSVRVNPVETRLAPIVRETAESFMVLAQARHFQIRLELEENVMVPVDAAAVRQIVLNLLDNASKYGPVGQTVVVGLGLFDEAARIWVDDEGPGVAKRERERVFDAFYRSPRDAQSATAGSGIGLSVVRELAVLHGGSAWIEDAPDIGARVIVAFPGAYVPRAQPGSDWAVA